MYLRYTYMYIVGCIGIISPPFLLHMYEEAADSSSWPLPHGAHYVLTILTFRGRFVCFVRRRRSSSSCCCDFPVRGVTYQQHNSSRNVEVWRRKVRGPAWVVSIEHHERLRQSSSNCLSIYTCIRSAWQESSGTSRRC